MYAGAVGRCLVGVVVCGVDCVCIDPGSTESKTGEIVGSVKCI